MSLTLATYNIHACVGTDGRFDPQRTVAVISELDADLVALQEVDHHRVDGQDLLEFLASATGLRAIAGPTLLRHDRHYGNAILTRMPVDSVRRVDLSAPGREPRGALDVSIVHQGLSLQIIATHLGLRPHERRVQVRQLLSLCDARVTDVTVLLGDINEWMLWGRPLRWLRAHFRPTPRPRSYPSGFPLFALDRIWVSPRSAISRIAAHRSPLARVASDHLPVKATLEAGRR